MAAAEQKAAERRELMEVLGAKRRRLAAPGDNLGLGAQDL